MTRIDVLESILNKNPKTPHIFYIDNKPIGLIKDLLESKKDRLLILSNLLDVEDFTSLIEKSSNYNVLIFDNFTKASIEVKNKIYDEIIGSLSNKNIILIGDSEDLSNEDTCLLNKFIHI
jgi:hypothetical protein